MAARWGRKHVTTILLSILFVVLLALYLYSSADDDERDGPVRPTVTVEKAPVPPRG
ncbi:hypothetical protein GOARA_059_00030 [Gordonia araii NBRC 100433]|uniref:Uncharacterized protein n=1 Tax=Gordonia araii NBRC 100433 TaxID=1073574 RepID=G7H3W2_9ACTN|nr:hypothetical protein [Gordonia araii]NNG99103.1 hypothetical protein [Gordonia araii NBRC 100433]GAB10537.1 hypothetical protein GOARA_059_00030 [Gordonia araii NBRC 100433]